MWKLFFEICDFLCNFIPSRRIRNKIRTEQLFDWRRKYNALRKKYPGLNFRRTKMIKGGWNIGFIVDKKYVFKIKKRFDKSTPTEKIMREKQITDAFRDISPLRIPKIDIVDADGYIFYKYDFIPGRNLNTYSAQTIKSHAPQWGAQIAEFIYAVHNARPGALDNMRGPRDGDGWNHNDICNNLIVDNKTMRIVGLIDWEYAGWGLLTTEFNNTVRFSKKIRESGIQGIIIAQYNAMATTKTAK